MTELDHWERELASFRRHLSLAPGHDYRSWQPTKWQSLKSVRDRLLSMCWAGRPGPDASALELGCGSATLLLQLQRSGVRGTGVDRDSGARALAAAAASSLGIAVPELLDVDFLDERAAARLPVTDLVFHIGVIEHFDEAAQLAFMRLSARLSRRWVMVGVPHLDGPIFRSFLTAVTAIDAVYDDHHEPVDVPALADRAGYRVAHADGLHLFFSSPDYYTPGDSYLDALYARLRDRLVAAGGEHYAAFPYVSFTPADIAILRRVEDQAGPEVRYRNGFLRYYVIDTWPRATCGPA